MTMRFSLFCLQGFAAGLLVFETWRTRSCDVSGRMVRFSKGLDRLLLFGPLLAAAVFAALFLLVLKGRLYERVCHAALVLALWLYATRFYWFLLSFSGQWKKKCGSFLRLDFFLCLAGMICAAGTAVYLTPLDRYAATIHSALGRASILPGACMMVLFYAAAILRSRKKGKREYKQVRLRDEDFFPDFRRNRV